MKRKRTSSAKSVYTIHYLEYEKSPIVPQVKRTTAVGKNADRALKNFEKVHPGKDVVDVHWNRHFPQKLIRHRKHRR